MPGLKALVKYKQPLARRSFGNTGEFTLESEERPKDKFYAFALIDRTNPKIFEYEDSPDGLESLSNLLRSGDVFGVIKGRRVTVELSSVVAVTVDDNRAEDWMNLSPEEV